MAASLAFDATDTDGASTSSGGSYTFPLTVAAASGQERLVFVAGISNGSPTTADFSAVTVDGQAATRVGTVSRGATDSGGNAAFITAWRAPGTSGTSINVVATLAVNAFWAYCGCFRLSGAGAVLATVTAAINDPSLNINTIANGTTAAAVLGYTSTGVSAAWTGLTERFDGVSVGGTEVFSGATLDTTTTETPRTVNADLTPNLSGTNCSIASLAVSFNPAAAGGLVKVWSGSAWVDKPVKVWTGSAWVAKPVKVWNGSAWV